MVIIFDFKGRERLGRAEHVTEAKDTLVNTSAHFPLPPKMPALHVRHPPNVTPSKTNVLSRENLILKGHKSNMS